MIGKLPLAPNGIFRTVQGEGALLGVPTVFVRLAGCSLGCANCDTDYRVAERLTPREIALRVADAAGSRIQWVWVTGGEPTDHDLSPLVRELRSLRLSLALATAGGRSLPPRYEPGGFDFVSVSPHDPAKWVQRSGTQLNVVPGLNGFSLADFVPLLREFGHAFAHRFVTPCAGKPETVAECVGWVSGNPGWKLGVQAHKLWGLP